MQKSLVYSYVGLLVLTLLVAVLSSSENAMALIFIIASISILKFWVVGLEFVELKKAHVFWKLLFVLFGLLIGSIFVILL
ncbi:MAG TPA: hypothetical protein VLZ11_05050 [Flavobacterium sp.]|nr:hypothetical protein [Flavobacterium sp.]